MNSFQFMKALMVKMILNGFSKLANFQFSIFNFAKRICVIAQFENLNIENLLKIENWQLEILGAMGNEKVRGSQSASLSNLI